jgi:hypothetical protein
MELVSYWGFLSNFYPNHCRSDIERVNARDPRRNGACRSAGINKKPKEQAFRQVAAQHHLHST